MTHAFIAIDNGTTSTRAMAFDINGRVLGKHSLETHQVLPQPGWVEQDAVELWRNTETVLSQLMSDLTQLGHSVASLGITNQRETTIAWETLTGEPLHNAIVWQDTRTEDWLQDHLTTEQMKRITHLTGLPISAYFSASKMRWLLDNVPEVANAAEQGRLAFGTPDSWLLWNLTGGTKGGVHLTDTTNASRTLLMDLETGQWSDELLTIFGINETWLPRIQPSISRFGEVATHHTPITCILGDQHASAFGHAAVAPGAIKNTYGTGNFLLMNTGSQVVRNDAGLITTVAYHIDGQPISYALEGSVAFAGSLIQWLRDNLRIIEKTEDAELLAETVPDNGDVYLVPAFSGLFAPYWRSDARGAIVGLTRFSNAGHIARAAIEATAYQTADLVSALNSITPQSVSELRVDGGMVANSLLMQFQADILGIPIKRPQVLETTALGAALGSALGIKALDSVSELADRVVIEQTWTPNMPEDDRVHLLSQWSKAIQKSLDWV